jgi:hypothetical protein
LSRKQLFRLRKPGYRALNPRKSAVCDQINECKKPPFHRRFCDARNLRVRYARAPKKFSVRERSMLSIKGFAAIARGTYTQY